MKHTKNDAVATVKNVQPIDVASMTAMIADDLNRAEVGKFSMLRAGVGLLCCKAMSEHGEWEARLMELCPGKSPRTLQTYMKDARDCLDARGIAPEAAWGELAKIDVAQVGSLMIAAPAQAQLGTGEPEPQEPAKRGRKSRAEAAPAPEASAAVFSQMLIDFIQQRKSAKAKYTEPTKPLTKREKMDAAVDEAARVVNIAADYVANATWALLPDDNLESTWAGFKATADKLGSEMKARNRNK